MTEMGFTYDPSTAGSSVRFDPPSKGDPVSKFVVSFKTSTLQLPSLLHFTSVSKVLFFGKLSNFFGTAHPDPTLQPHKLREYAQKLKRRYGWDESELAKLG